MGDFIKKLGNAAAGGVFGLATSAFNHHLAEKSAQKQYDRQLDFWEKQNAYNHPAQQRRRLEQAGLNPVAAINGIAGNNSAGQLSSVPGNEVAQRGALDLGALNNSISLLGHLESVGANTDLLKKQIEISAIEKMIKNSEHYGIKLDNKTKQELLKWLPREKFSSILDALSRIKNTSEDTRGKQILNDEKQEARDEGINTFKDAHRAADDAHLLSFLQSRSEESRKLLLDTQARLADEQAWTEQFKQQQISTQVELEKFFGPIERWSDIAFVHKQIEKLTSDMERNDAMTFIDSLIVELRALELEASLINTDKIVNAQKYGAHVNSITNSFGSLLDGVLKWRGQNKQYDK